MKLVALLFLIIYTSYLSAQGINTAPLRFLEKSTLDTSANHFGHHIKLKSCKTYPDSGFMDITDDRTIFYDYSCEDKISILAEYLTFKGDISPSNKVYKFEPSVAGQQTLSLQIQVEALFSFTRMLTSGFPKIRPILYHRGTDRKIVLDDKIVQEIYDLYKKWLARSKGNGFKGITLPLMNTSYMWYGETEDVKLYLIDDL